MHNDRAHYLPRLPREFYQSDAVVYWTLNIFDKATGWLTEGFHGHFRELMLHVAAHEGLCCPVYSLMPDHIHLIWMGLNTDTDQLNGMAFFRTHLKPLLTPHKLQPQPFDHVLREDERKRNAFAGIGFYILNNPVKASLVKDPKLWPYSGAIIPGYPTLHPLNGDFWGTFWKLFVIAHTASGRRLPPRSTSPPPWEPTSADSDFLPRSDHAQPPR